MKNEVKPGWPLIALGETFTVPAGQSFHTVVTIYAVLMV
jgi:hypothetical protein